MNKDQVKGRAQSLSAWYQKRWLPAVTAQLCIPAHRHLRPTGLTMQPQVDSLPGPLFP